MLLPMNEKTRRLHVMSVRMELINDRRSSFSLAMPQSIKPLKRNQSHTFINLTPQSITDNSTPNRTNSESIVQESQDKCPHTHTYTRKIYHSANI